MLLERHPSLLDLTAEEKLQLAEELWMDAAMDAWLAPSLRERVNQRLKVFRDHPESGLSWDEVKGRILEVQRNIGPESLN